MKYLILILLTSCIDTTYVDQEPELLNIAIEVRDELELRGVNVNVYTIPFMFDDSLISKINARAYYVSHTIIFDTGFFEEYIEHNPYEVYATMAHELGHHLGLKHTTYESPMSSPIRHVYNKDELNLFYDDLAELVNQR